MVSARPGARKIGASVNRFDVSVYAIRRRAGRRRPFEVRWQAAGRSRSKSFLTRKLADSYRAELVRAARTGLEFDPLTGEPTAWNLSEPATVTWYPEATAYAVMKWPSPATHSRASVAEALATVTPALTRPGASDRPDPRELRMALYQHAFNPARPAGPGSAAAQIPRLDAAGVAARPLPQRAVLCRASPGGSRRPAPRRLRSAQCQVGPCSGWPRPRPGPLPPGPAAAQAMNCADSSTGRTGRFGWSWPLRCSSPCSAHITAYGPAPDGRLFRGTRGGPLSGSVYGRAWQSARTIALGPELAADGLPRRPTTCVTPPCRCG